MLPNNQKIKILHIITNLPVGGAQDNTLITIENLDKSKYDVTLMSASDGDWLERALNLKDVKLIFVNELVRKIHIVYDFIALIKIFFYIKKGNYDIVHTHSSKPGFSGRIAAKLAGVPIIIHTIHGFPFNDFMNPFARKFFIYLERLLSKLSDALITVSNLNLQKAVDLKIAPMDKFTNIYSGICFGKFDVNVDIAHKKDELGFGKNDKIVGMVGRLSAQKSPKYFIKAIPDVLSVEPDTKFLLVGDGELRQELESIIKKLKITENVKILGYRDDVPELLSIIDVFVLTSSWEGLGRSLTEAMYLKRPVVATAVEGVPELVIHKKTGLLVPPKNSESISDAILYLLKHPEICESIGEEAGKKVRDDFSAEKMISQIQQLYRKLIADRYA